MALRSSNSKNESWSWMFRSCRTSACSLIFKHLTAISKNQRVLSFQIHLFLRSLLRLFPITMIIMKLKCLRSLKCRLKHNQPTSPSMIQKIALSFQEMKKPSITPTKDGKIQTLRRQFIHVIWMSTSTSKASSKSYMTTRINRSISWPTDTKAALVSTSLSFTKRTQVTSAFWSNYAIDLRSMMETSL